MAVEAKLRKEILSFRQNFKTVIIASSNGTEPDASYAPYLEDENSCFYIFISALACHTKNIINNPQLDLLWIENENESSNLFARKRLQLNCMAEEITKNSTEWQNIINNMQQHLGSTIKVLKELPDFHLIKLIPRKGTFVQGFAKAFNLSKDDLGKLND